MKKFFITLAIGSLMLWSPVLALAQINGITGAPSGSVNGTTGAPADQSLCNGSTCTVQNPLNVTSFCGLLQKILSAIIEIGIPVAVLFLIIVGFKFILARGNPAELAVARKNLLYTIIGIAIFIGAWAITQVIVTTMADFGVTVAACRS